ncbi:hypothetical protein IAT38_006558 [Cryptococcus sp. DSM 104549]
MPIPTPPPTDFPLFPTLTRAQIDAARTSAWYETFEDITAPATVIDLRELGEEEAFLEWLEADSIFLPEGSDGARAPPIVEIPESPPASPPARQRSTSNASASSSSSSSSSVAPVYKLPKLNAAIREALAAYGGAVFPKLNWTSPKDAAFILPQGSSGPLHCTSPADVYLLLKSSDFISHDLDPERAYAGVEEGEGKGEGEGEGEEGHVRVELVLKKFEGMVPSREVRCFVRNNALIGVSQRDLNFYDHLQPEETRTKICDTVRAFWEDEVRENFAGGKDYVFDLHLSANLESATIIDFQPYRASTDPLLFTYDDLLTILETSFASSTPSPTATPPPRLPILRTIDSPSHPAATRAAPAYQSSMMPLEMIELSEGRSMGEFKEAWEEAVRAGMMA